MLLQGASRLDVWYAFCAAAKAALFDPVPRIVRKPAAALVTALFSEKIFHGVFGGAVAAADARAGIAEVAQALLACVRRLPSLHGQAVALLRFLSHQPSIGAPAVAAVLVHNEGNLAGEKHRHDGDAPFALLSVGESVTGLGGGEHLARSRKNAWRALRCRLDTVAQIVARRANTHTPTHLLFVCRLERRCMRTHSDGPRSHLINFCA